MPASSFFKPRTDYATFNARHDGAFADVVRPAEFPEARIRFWNDSWAERVGLGSLSEAERIAAFARFQPDAISKVGLQTSPLAMRYHGHQFRHYNPQIGDGRGFLYAQLEDPVDHRLLDFGTKGSGTTPYSRSGDGRLTLKGAVREALATEMLEALGVNTSKTFAFFETGEKLERNDEPSPTRAAVLTRLSHGHIRYGTFQRLAVGGDSRLMSELVDYSIHSYFPSLAEDVRTAKISSAEKPFAFLEQVVANAADMVAAWMTAGFVHGVLNTDNMNITGESFDYGPWRFLPFYDPTFTAAYFDHDGLYAYSRQPESVYWNLDQLARSLFAMVPAGQETAWQERFVTVLSKFPAQFQSSLLKKFFLRLGLTAPADEKMGEEVFMTAFQAMAESKVPYEDFFYDWYGGALRPSDGAGATFAVGGIPTKVAEKYQSPASITWSDLMRDLMATDRLQDRAETFSILGKSYYKRGHPESMLIDEVEAIWSAIDKNDDWKPFEVKIAAVRERGKIHGF